MANQSLRSFRSDYSWGWTAMTGIFLVAFGLVVIAAAYVTTLAVSWTLGLVLVASGAVQLVHAFRNARGNGSAVRFLLAALSIVAGLVLLRSPLTGAIGITLILAFYLLFSAVARGTLLLEVQRKGAKAWLILSSFLSGVFGVYLLVTFPVSSLVIPGTLLGVDLLFYGLFELNLALRLRRHNSMDQILEFRRSA